MFTKSVMSSNYLILCHSLLLLPSIFPSISIFFHWVSSSHQVAQELELQHQSFQWICSTDFLYDWLVGSLCSPRDSQESSPTLQFKSINSSVLSFLYGSTLTSIHDDWKNHNLSRWIFVGRVMSLLFNMQSRLVIAFLPRSKVLLISWLQSPSAVTLESKKIKSPIISIVSPSICHEVTWLDAMILVFWMLTLKPAFSLSSFTFIKRFLSSSSLSAIRAVSPVYEVIDIHPGNLDSSLCFIQPIISHDLLYIKKEMATYSSTLAWKIPRT